MIVEGGLCLENGIGVIRSGIEEVKGMGGMQVRKKF